MNKFIISLAVLFNSIVFINLNAQQAVITAGPMLGYTEHREASVWVQTQCAKTVSLRYWPVGSNEKKSAQTVAKQTEGCIATNLTFVLPNLNMATTYNYEIALDGKPVKFTYPLTFKTKTLWEWRTDPPDFTFMIGSCFYVNDSAYDRPGKPFGQGTEILNKMNEKPSDFMIWLGDNTYTREADYSSVSGLNYRYAHTRSDKNLQTFLASRNHYAIWDDHDYGPNDSDKSYGLKKASLQIFKDYWPNKFYGDGIEGIYSNFLYSDAEFFLLDNRYFRDNNEISEKYNPGKTQLGQKQLDWLFNALLFSKATFKFIVVGGQFLNKNTDKESFVYFKNERQRIINFIIEHKISGVIFLSGDRHHTELIKDVSVKQKLGYDLMELTSSPISAGPANIAQWPEFNNPMRVQGTLVAENNFCTITISGSRKNRNLTMQCYDKYGAMRWEKTFNENDLKPPVKESSSKQKPK
ncbi:MAG: alkaline phosphatase D family protein [Bacteroidia bacterium]